MGKIRLKPLWRFKKVENIKVVGSEMVANITTLGIKINISLTYIKCRRKKEM